MGLVGHAILTVDEFNLPDATREDIIAGFVLDLPFRLRLGGLYRQRFRFRDGEYEIALLNAVEIPPGTPFEETLRHPHESLWTRALVMIRNPPVSDEVLHSVCQYDLLSDAEPPRINAPFVRALGAFNHFLVAYSTATGDVFGGRPLRLLRVGDFFELLEWEIAIICCAGAALSDGDCLGALQLEHERKFVVQHLHGELADLDVDAVRARVSESLSLQEVFLHEELAFEAKTKMVAGDNSGALLLAVAALEGVHAAFVQRRFSELDPEGRDLPEDFMRELGMTLCNRTTPLLLMPAESRPDSDLIALAGHALKIRNEIMHALRNRRGEYRIRTRTEQEISDAYSAVLRLYEVYRTALGTCAADA